MRYAKGQLHIPYYTEPEAPLGVGSLVICAIDSKPQTTKHLGQTHIHYSVCLCLYKDGESAEIVSYPFCEGLLFWM